MGISAMTLMDHDTVAVENLDPQGYWPEDLDQPGDWLEWGQRPQTAAEEESLRTSIHRGRP